MAMLLEGLNDKNKLVQIGNRSDSCHMCMLGLNIKNIEERQKAVQALRGKLEGVKMVKFVRNGIETCICPDCMKKIHDELFKKEK